MVETSAAPEKSRKSLWEQPFGRLIFYTLGFLVIAGAVAAIFGGWPGVIFLAGLAAAAVLMLYATAAGETAGRRYTDIAARNALPSSAALGYRAMESFPDPVLITDRRGAPRWGNAAYKALADQLASIGQSFALPSIDRLWAGAGGGDGAVYRLSLLAARGKSGQEILPPIAIGDAAPVAYRLEAQPQGEGLILWRLLRADDEAGSSMGGLADWSDNAPVALFSLRKNGDVAHANVTFRDWVGLADGDPLPRLDAVLAGDGARAVMNTRGGETVSRIDARLKARDGIESPVAVVVEWTKSEPVTGRAVMYGLSATGAPPGVAQAMSDGRQAGHTLDEMFASAPFGVVRLDGADPETAIIEDVNPALVQLSQGKALPGVKFCDIFNWDDGRSATDAFAAAMAGSSEPAEARLAADKPLYVHLAFAPARGGKRVAYVIDVTSWKDLERQFSQANKMQAVGQLAGGVAHDFNNLLTAVRLNTDELLNRHPVGDPDYGELQSINQTVARAAGLVRKLLAFSRKQTFRMESLDIGDVLSDVSVLLRQIVEETVQLDIIHGRDLPMIKADKGQLETAIINLAANARDAMRDGGGGRLEVRTRMLDADDVRQAGAPNPRDGDWVAIDVADEGHGMDAETLGKIFEPFFTTKEAGKGTGLGLATVYGIVKQSGGFLFADSEVGKGTTFTIYLPGYEPTEEESVELQKAEAAKTIEPAPADLSGRGRILLVEDEDAVRSIAAKTLIKRGYEVFEAGDGEEALEILEDEDPFDLLISDVVMPVLDGPGLLEKGREMLKDTRIVFISGYAAEQFSKTLSEEQDISFLPKPFTLTQLAEKVKHELGAVE